MSLKAKLEAVIYAAEEPVTLAQLAVLFAHEAMEWKAEQEAARAALASDQAAEGAQTLPLELRADEAHENGSETGVGASAVPAPDSPGDESAETTAEEVTGEETAAAEPTGSQTAADGEDRRLARLRDREVKAILRQLIDELVAYYASDDRGIEIREIAGGYRMATKPECHDAVRQFVRSLKPALRLSLPALETLAVVAYKQPVTAPEVNEIRGVDSSGVFGSLLARKLIATAGRKQVIGRPILYKTTREFLLRFGLKDVNELPSMEEFEKMAALELDEPETRGESEPVAHREDNPSLEFDETASEKTSAENDGGQDPPAALENHPAPAENNLVTAVMADQPTPAQSEERATPSPSAVDTATPAEPTPAEAAPAAPPSTEQAENESTPHGY
jgi:segregation and condensation protein B